MNETPPNYQDQLEALRLELESLKSRLKEIEKVVQIYDESDGSKHVLLECTSIAVRPPENRRTISIQIDGRLTGGPFISFLHQEGDDIRYALELALDEGGAPHITLNGKDRQARANLFIENDHGVMAMMGPGHQPGAVIRALPGGGSVAVLQPDGQARGVLVHQERRRANGEDDSATELIFASGAKKTLAKLRGDAEGGFLVMGMPTSPNTTILSARDEGGSLILRSKSQEHGIACIASEKSSMVCAHQGTYEQMGTESALIAGSELGSLILRDSEHKMRVDISAGNGFGTVALPDGESKDPPVSLSHHAGSHSTLAMSGVAKHDCFRIIADKDLTTVRLAAPQSEESQIVNVVHEMAPSIFLRKDGALQVALATGDDGGFVNAHGRDPELGGFASLMGGPLAGRVIVSSADGTPQITLDATDYGGRLLVNNDIGFQRIVLGTYQESSGLILNQTGSEGVAISALPHGGLITIYDSEGRPVQNMPDYPPDAS